MAADGITAFLDISRRSLFTQSQALRVISNNISNVNTPEYSRRRINLESLVGASLDTNSLGAGVDINGVTRLVDSFVNNELERRISDRAEEETRDQILAGVEIAFGLDGGTEQIGSALTAFFGALDTLATNPASEQLRDQVLQAGEVLTRSVRNTFNQVAASQRESDTRISSGIDTVNELTRNIADLNLQIASAEAGQQENLTLRDRRDQLLRDLAEQISFSKVEDTQGQVTISLSSGFALVQGATSRQLEFSTSPSFGAFPQGLDGSQLGAIVYDFDPAAGSESHGDLTSVIANGSGAIAGLLNLRGVQATTDTDPFDADGDLIDIAARVETIARELLTTFNRVYRGDDPDTLAVEDEDSGTAGTQARSGDLDGNTPGVFGLFTFNDITGDGDDDSDGLPELADLTAASLPAFANRLQFGVTDARALAVALDLDAADGSTQFAQGDASNITNLLKLRTATASASVGNFTPTGNIESINQSVTALVGSLKSVAENNTAVFQAREDQVKAFRDSVSSVSIDEEFTNLIKFQRSYEASARLIRVGDELISEVLALLN